VRIRREHGGDGLFQFRIQHSALCLCKELSRLGFKTPKEADYQPFCRTTDLKLNIEYDAKASILWMLCFLIL
jgi:hypothetical protein